VPRNLEIKVPVPSFHAALLACRKIKARKVGTLRQTDTYFNVRKGRLKLREIDGKKFELIYYKRANRNGSRYSNYTVVSMNEPTAIRSVCTSLFGVRVIVRKNRLLYLHKNARIHLDTVIGLGKFIEFEVLVKDGCQQARQLMESLIREFGVGRRSGIPGSYEDLMSAK